MNLFIPLIAGMTALVFGIFLGYYARQSIAQKQTGSIEAKIRKKVLKAKQDSETIISKAQQEAEEILAATKKETDSLRYELFKTERILLKRENFLNQKVSAFEESQKEFQERIEKVNKKEQDLEKLREESLNNLERISKLSREEAKKELVQNLEKTYQQEILEKIRKLEREGWEKYEKEAKKILATAIQKYGLSQTQEISTSLVALPSDEIKGKIIGKEGRNIRALEKLTGVEIIIDETPESVLLSCFSPIRRQVAKIALEKLIKDGRIQPARIEEQVKSAEIEVIKQTQEAGEAAVFDLGIIGFDPKLIQLLGRLRFRTSYGQNVLTHSIEVAYLASALASEIGADVLVCKKAGLMHDIGKAVDHQIEGSHTDIGIKILEKFGIEKEIISAMKSHHEEYPAETIEALLVQTADQISGARPGARKDTLENYLKRLKELENIALRFPGVEKSWALQAGREVRVFVKPEEISDLEARNLARAIAGQIQEELTYPGEIKVNVIRESRVTEYAK